MEAACSCVGGPPSVAARQMALRAKKPMEVPSGAKNGFQPSRLPSMRIGSKSSSRRS
jgi:hypothetical protein